MNRKNFIKSLIALPIIGSAMNISELGKLSQTFGNSPKMPVLFLGHGNPMNAIEENEFVEGFRKQAKSLPKPNAILCISAHWETNGTFVTAMQQPRTIHDFGGFPQEVFDVQYPAPGSPELAQETKNLVTKTEILLDHKWGLDHGAWSVIKHLYPEANIPTIQMSIDYNQSPEYHFDLAKQLSALRSKGILIIGSGNIVHNLRMVDWRRVEENYGYDWAIEANENVKSLILTGDFKSLVEFRNRGKAFDLSIPTPEHFLPLLYTLALKEEKESIEFFNDKPVGGSLSMTSMKIFN